MDLKSLFGFEGKNVVITGAGSGMGKAATKLLVELGANVYASVRRKPLDFEVTKEIKADLGSKEGLDAFISELPDEIEALFICHGISNTKGNTNAMQVQLTNFLAFKYLTQALLPRISDNGSVSFISSDGGRQWQKMIGPCMEVIETKTWEDAVAWYESHPDIIKAGYVFAKQCQNVFVMSQVHAPEFIDRKIRLNAIEPGMTLTGLTEDFNKSVNEDAERGQKILEKLYLDFWNGRWASPEEMGYPLVVLGSKICSYVSGQLLYIDYGTSSMWDFKDLTEAKEI
jgi:NAD(P)-dependent dehydrogenase (short-subunit alcohol dehydrogenase family)